MQDAQIDMHGSDYRTGRPFCEPAEGQGKGAAMNAHHATSDNLDRHTRFTLSNLGRPETMIALATGQGWGVKGRRRQQTLFCVQGRVWITQEGDIRDYLLESGDAFLITLPGLTLVRALTPSRIGYSETALPVPFKGRFSQTVFN
jgi:hypothetical protein